MRAFIAVSLKPTKNVADLLEELRGIKGVRVVKNDVIHLTLNFLGDITDEFKDELCSDLSGIRFQGFSLKLTKINGFPYPRRARVIVVDSNSLEIRQLQDQITSLIPEGMRDKREFKPHLTLARARIPLNIERFSEKYKETDFGEYVIDRFCLYQSVLKPEGPEYTTMCCNQLI